MKPRKRITGGLKNHTHPRSAPPLPSREIEEISNAPSSLAEAYALLGALLEYPGEDFVTRIADCRKAILEHCPEAAASLFQFERAMGALEGSRPEEAYLRAFDVAPLCVPYVSVHLFGEENFRRGEFMARLLDYYGKDGFDCQGELPDHVAVLLEFAPRLIEEERHDLLKWCLLGPLGDMRKSLVKADHPYRFLLSAVLEFCETDLKKEVCHA